MLTMGCGVASGMSYQLRLAHGGRGRCQTSGNRELQEIINIENNELVMIYGNQRDTV